MNHGPCRDLTVQAMLEWPENLVVLSSLWLVLLLMLLLLLLLLSSQAWSSPTAPGNLNLHVFDVWHAPIHPTDRPWDPNPNPNQTSGEGVEGPEGYTLEHG